MQDNAIYNLSLELAQQITNTCKNQEEALKLIGLLQQLIAIRFPTFPKQPSQ